MTYKEIVKEAEKLNKQEREKFLHYLVKSISSTEKEKIRLLLLEDFIDKKSKNPDDDDFSSLLLAEHFLSGYSEKDDIYNNL